MSAVWLALALLAVWLLVLPLSTWVFYLAVMHIDKMAHQEIASPEAYAIARRAIFPIGALHNAVLAWTWAPALFLALPREFATTKFLNRMVERGGWRADHAQIVRRHFLNYYDRRGVHT